MKTTRFFAISILLLYSIISIAQSSLADSPRSSSEVHIYKISKNNLRKVHLKEEGFNESMLSNFVARYKKDEPIPNLDRGNYVRVSIVDNQLNYNELIIDDLYAKIVPSERFVVCLYDSLGNIIDNAEIRKGASKLKYDQKTRTYITNKVKDETIIEIAHNGVYHYMEVEDNQYRDEDGFFRKTWWKIRGLWDKTRYGVKQIFYSSERPTKQKYTGFVVFSKPKYKPGETVKLKAYLSEYNGKKHTKTIDLRLRDSGYRSNIDTLLTRLEPYQAGMYSYEFKLMEELDLMLDKDYSVSLVTDESNVNIVSARFRYEDYELKGINFSLKSDKKEFALGDSIKLDMRVTDENEMAVYDGKIEILVTPENFDQNKLRTMTPVFIPDTLWTHTVDLFGSSEKEFVLPDSIFPTSVDLKFKVRCTYLSADNEKHVESLYLTKLNKKHTLDFTLDKGMLTIKELYLGESQPISAQITISGEDSRLFQDSVMLPHTLAIPWHAEDLLVETKHTREFFQTDGKVGEQLTYKFYRRNDSIYLKVDNPANIPFWYIIRKMKKEIAKGYVTQLDYTTKDTGEDGYSMQLSYLFGGGSKSIEAALPFAQKNISMDVTTATTVYPGQKTSVQISVVDKKGKPVKDADITAYSFTSKFKNYSMPNIPIGGKAKYAKEFRNIRYEMDDDWIYNSKSSLTWKRWADAMVLDTIEYYKFLYPETYYVHKEPSVNKKTQILPFVVINGEVQGVHMLWIDERLYYSNQSQNLNLNIFEVEAGKHSLRFRTHNREILALNFHLEEGTRHIMSFNAGKPYTKIPYEDPMLTPFVLTSRLLTKEERGRLSEKEETELRGQLITIDNNFGEIELPNVHQRIEIPGYINTGNTLYYLNHINRSAYNSTLRTQVRTPILAGPFPKRNAMGGISNIGSVYAGDRLLANVEIEGGNHYTLYPNYQKIKQWNKSVIDRKALAFKPSIDFNQQPLTKEDIDNRVENKITNIMQTSAGFVDVRQQNNTIGVNGYQLNLVLGRDTTGSSISPTLIFIEPKKEEDRKDFQLYYGGVRNFKNLPTEELTLHLIFKDSTSYSYPIQLYKGGMNYLKLDSIATYQKNLDVMRIANNLFEKGVKKHYVSNPYTSRPIEESLTLSPIFDRERYSDVNNNKRVVTGIVRDGSDVVIGATVKIKGTDKGVITDFDGRFEIGLEGNATLEVMFVGYKPEEINVSTGYAYNIKLKEDESRLDEVVVIGYGVQKKANLTGSVSVVTTDGLSGYFDNQILRGRVAGLMIRGASSTSTKSKPLIIINGLPFDGNLEDIDASTILSLNMLKDAVATSIYGSRAVDGVIMIETNALSSPQLTDSDEISSEEVGNSMRRNFHDDAFWQPRLKTDEKGEVNFEVTYPDDITNWNAYFIALGGKNQSDTKQMSIKSFKALSARLSTSRFAIRGDSLNVVGKVANHFGDSLQLTRTIALDNAKQIDRIKIGNSHVDYIPVNVTDGDSLTLAYSLQMENGYFDGEERSFPILEQGLLQTYGDFKVINDSAIHILKTDSKLGTVTVHAEASSLELFLREIENIDRYPYMCNEQMASKIKALLAKKYIYKIQGKDFKEDKKINSLIRDLNKNRNKEGLWGWWNKSESVMWISKHIINALLDAEEAGYKTDLGKHTLTIAFEQELKNSLSSLPLVVNKKMPFAKGELLDRLIFLKRINAPIDYKDYYYQVDNNLENQTVTDRLKSMLVMSSIGLQDSIKSDSLMYYSSKTILGSLYWAEKSTDKIQARYFYRPHETNTENTLLAYQVLKNIGGYEKELESIRNYFFEQRQNNTWGNIYESSRIVQALMPDMLKEADRYTNVVMSINGNKVSKFPYTTKLDSTDKIEVSKTGTMPLFITAYQREWDKTPSREKSKGFDISTVFKMNKDSVANLKEGKNAILEVKLDIKGDAEYVQIEIPIPAGCSYESKSKGNYWKEAHREHYKERVVIFCNKLSKGEHIFNIELLPRYTGRYTLNPAKVELMYFPTFYGNEEIKTTWIK